MGAVDQDVVFAKVVLSFTCCSDLTCDQI